ncbi:hypothetical protein BSKO_00126 [Bryopsis sp. KO-2023]|nr:hypothetical protein BSKO_00126 [Bryopsis sp. KO-2023]
MFFFRFWVFGGWFHRLFWDSQAKRTVRDDRTWIFCRPWRPKKRRSPIKGEGCDSIVGCTTSHMFKPTLRWTKRAKHPSSPYARSEMKVGNASVSHVIPGERKIMLDRGFLQRPANVPLLSRRFTRRSGRKPTCLSAALAEDTEVETVQKYHQRSKDGYMFTAEIAKGASEAVVTFAVERDALPRNEVPLLNWGFYRASRSKLYHPDKSVPSGSKLHKKSGAMRSPMHLNEATMQYETQVDVPLALEPVTLGCSLYLPGLDMHISPSAETEHFCIPIGMRPGSPEPLGLSLVDREEESPGTYRSTVNFSVVSRHAEAMTLCLVRLPAVEGGQTGYMELALDPLVNKTGDVWHVTMEGLRDVESLCYGWRADGWLTVNGATQFDPMVVLLDPYAKVVVQVTLPDSAGKGSGNLFRRDRCSEGLLGSLSELAGPAFDWGNSAMARLPLEQSIVCTVDLRESEITEGAFNRAKGMVEKLVSIGANTMLLCGVQHMETNFETGESAPLHVFSPDTSLASNSNRGQANRELKELVKECHARGVEVMLQVEYCFTSENKDGFPQKVSLGGLDSALYYRNGVINCGHPIVRKLILDSLRNWAENYQVDGFVFLNAETMTQDRDGVVQDNPSLPEDISEDPVLRRCKMVAVSGNDQLLPRWGERGFPHWGVWLEWNKRFQSDVWEHLVRAFDGKLSAVATRVTGSADLFAARWDGGLPWGLAVGRRPSFGFNCPVPALTSLNSAFGGDVVANTSMVGSLVVAALLFQGVPVLPVEVLTMDFLAKLVRNVTRVRKQYEDLLQPPSFSSSRHFEWHGAGPGSQPDWDGGSNFIAYSIRPQSDSTRGVYVAFNPHIHEVTAELPYPGPNLTWQCRVDTSQPAPSAGTGFSSYIISAKSAVVFDKIETQW